MKKIIVMIILLTTIFFTYSSYATDEIIASQKDALEISSLIKEGEKYTKDVFPDLSLEDFFNSALQGKVDNKSILNSIFSLFADELVSTITLLRKYFSNSCYT